MGMKDRISSLPHISHLSLKVQGYFDSRGKDEILGVQDLTARGHLELPIDGRGNAHS